MMHLRTTLSVAWYTLQPTAQQYADAWRKGVELRKAREAAKKALKAATKKTPK